MKKLAIILSILFITALIIPAGFCRRPPDKDIEKEMRKLEVEREKEEKKMLDELKRRDPEGYKRFLVEKKREDKKRKIINSYREGKISKADAHRRLRPFVKEEVNVKSFLRSADQQIKMFEKEIEHLKKIKRNPQLLIEERIDSYLGIRSER